MNKLFLAIIALVVVIGGYLILTGDKNSSSDMDDNQYQSSQTETVSTDTTTQTQDNTTSETVTSATPETTTKTTTTPTTTTKAPTQGYTLAQVAQHADSKSCYSAVNGVVYDLTSWIARHPGGQREILAICGRDGSSAFNGQHGGQSRPEQLLAGFEIGALVK